MKLYDPAKEKMITDIYQEKLKIVKVEHSLKGDYSNVDSLVDEIQQFNKYLESHYEKAELVDLFKYVSFLEKLKFYGIRILTFIAVLALILWFVTFLFGNQERNTLYLFVIIVVLSGVYFTKYLWTFSIFRPLHELTFVRESLEFENKKRGT